MDLYTIYAITFLNMGKNRARAQAPLLWKENTEAERVQEIVSIWTVSRHGPEGFLSYGRNLVTDY